MPGTQSAQCCSSIPSPVVACDKLSQTFGYMIWHSMRKELSGLSQRMHFFGQLPLDFLAKIKHLLEFYYSGESKVVSLKLVVFSGQWGFSVPHVDSLQKNWIQNVNPHTTRHIILFCQNYSLVINSGQETKTISSKCLSLSSWKRETACLFLYSLSFFLSFSQICPLWLFKYVITLSIPHTCLLCILERMALKITTAFIFSFPVVLFTPP